MIDTEKYYFDDKAADNAVRFIETYLVHQKGDLAGTPFLLLPWQKELVRDVFGTKRNEDKTRRYREVYLEIPSGNGKSLTAAALALLLLFCDNEQGGTIVSAAISRSQSHIVFDIAKQMVQDNPQLSKLATCYQDYILCKSNRNIYRCISSEAGNANGLDCTGVVLDEFHVQADRELYDVLRKRVRSRKQPLTVYITTAGDDVNSVCYTVHEHAAKVAADPSYDESFYAKIYAADKNADWADIEIWKKANPSLGISPTLEFAQREIANAKALPSAVNSLKRYNLDIWTQSAEVWINDTAWIACNGKVDREALRGKSCIGGMDLSTRNDVTALSLLFPSDDGTYDLLSEFWLPKDNAIEKEKADRTPYTTWERQGYLHLTDGNVIDYSHVAARLLSVAAEFDLREIAIDRRFANYLYAALDKYGEITSTCKFIEYNCGYSGMSEPSKQLEMLVQSKRIRNGFNPIMRWMVSNCILKTNTGGEIMPDKNRSRGRIDGVAATVMALGLSMSAKTKTLTASDYLSFL